MAKPKSPLLSLGAHGTIGDALTYQKRGRDTIARVKPVPADPYSLPQAYQRWLYKDYAYLWTLQTNSQKQVYRTRASRYHITGFSLWMREHLRDLPDIVAMWHLDEKAGAIAYDSGPNHLNGTIFGATPTDGLIDGAQSLDGLNDWIDLGNDPLLFPTTNFTIEAFVYPTKNTTIRVFSNRGSLDTSSGFVLTIDTTGALSGLYCYIAGVGWKSSPNVPIILNAWNHLIGIFDSITITALLDGVPYSTPQVGIVKHSYEKAAIGRDGAHAFSYFEGKKDHVILYNRALNITEGIRHSLRRYPA